MINFFYCKRAGNASVQFLKYIYLMYHKKKIIKGSQQVWRKKEKIEKFRVHKLSRIGQYRIFRV